MRFHCTALIVALTATMAGAPAAAQQAAVAPATGEAAFTVFVGGRPVGREHVTVSRGSSGWIITSNGRQSAPVDLTVSRFEMKYTQDWQPLELKIEGVLRNAPIKLATSFTLTTAINEVTQTSVTNSKEDQISARTIVLPNNFYGAYEALAVRLSATDVGAELPIYVAPQMEIKATVRSITPETLSGPSGVLHTRRFDVTFANPGGPLDAVVTVDDRARLVRLELPSANVLVARDDASSVATRPSTVRNPTDADVTIVANGFNLAGTITTVPQVAGRLRTPAVVLIGGSGPTDRDETVAGIPIFAQLAKGLADRGLLVLRYDKRGVGQSGGRTESATLSDYAEDAITAVKWLARRKDVDPDKIIACGHSEGGAVALMAAAREKKIAGVVSIAAPGSSGADLILEQQQHLLEVMKAPDAERQAKIELQKKIQTAVVSGTGWEDVPPELRKQADTPWFRSLLTYEPAAVLDRVKQPILIVQGDRDTQVRPAHADRLAELARARKKAGTVDVVHVPGMNHLLVPATTGEVSEYSTLRERSVSPKVFDAIADWIKKTF
jgi:pimeloyl-ACP methyl ester carboxylesterase